ncbi:Hypothetical protein LUCI_4333 [Lucifera butyrica]|uniref:PsbP C-terminal domain-containing protein n=1 Tax=Lucifera butyrica TaxID=1351585 RepID=A0A498RDP2_9FIRM|nr:hypothetical protein [Lucifera butyrica]VBB09047.1 Hypothetical protein LUCI_4333 [Lucifera butyrica]
MKNIILIAFLFTSFLLIPATTQAAIYEDTQNNYQINLPDDWVIANPLFYPEYSFLIEQPASTNTSIAMMISDNSELGMAKNKTFNDLSDKEIDTFMKLLSKEFINILPKVKIESTKAIFFPKQRAIEITYLYQDNKFCLTTFLMNGKAYMLFFCSSQQEYQKFLPTYLKILNTLKPLTLNTTPSLPLI